MKLEIEIRNCISFTMQMLNKSDTVRGGYMGVAAALDPPLTVYLAVENIMGKR